MVGALIAAYVIGLIVQLLFVAVDIDTGGAEEGIVFRLIFFPIDWLRAVYRSFNRWRAT